jgi:replicative DNA helicase
MNTDRLFCERAVLAALMLGEAEGVAALDELEEKHFTKSAHKKIFTACAAALAQSRAVDAVLCAEKLKSQGWLVECGGEKYLSELLATQSNTPHTAYYCGEIKKAYHKDLQLKAAEAFPRDGDAEELISRISSAAREIDAIENNHGLTLKEIAAQAINSFDNPAAQIKIGYKFLDDKTPAEPGDLIVIGGQTSTGKSLLNINLIKSMAEVAPERKFLVYTTEMTPLHFFKRQIALYTSVPYWVIKKRNFNLEQISKINKFCGEFSALNNERIFYSSNLAPSLEDITAEIKRVKPVAVFLDNLSGVSLPTRHNNKTDNIGDFVRGLKRVCMDNGAIAFLTCHLRKDARLKPSDEPELWHLKDSSSIEETGTLVMLIWGKLKESPDELSRPKEINYKIAKDRDGQGGAGGAGTLYLNRNTLEITED